MARKVCQTSYYIRYMYICTGKLQWKKRGSWSGSYPWTEFVREQTTWCLQEIQSKLQSVSPSELWYFIYIVLTTMRLHYNADSIITWTPRGFKIFFQYTVCENDRGIHNTMQAVKIIFPVYFLAKFDTS